MARPQKDNAEYFSHDRDMRNDDRILALRSKFGITGYAVWVMFLEILTGCDGFEIKLDEIRSEIVAGDIRVSPNEMHEILGFCHRIDLIQIENGIFSCKKLKERLKPITEKREFLRQKYQEKILKQSENIVSAPETPISGDKTTQSKVNKSKLNKTKEIYNIEDLKMRDFLRKIVGLDEFKDELEHIGEFTELMEKIGQEEFNHRLKEVLSDPFKAKNCTKLKFLYGEIKSFIHSPIVQKEENHHEVY